MTDENDPTDDPEDEELLDDGGEGSTPSSGGRVPLLSVVGVACLLLMLTGIVLFSFLLQRALDPEEALCSSARASIADANDDDDEFNDVVLDGDVDDVSCDEALAMARSIPTSEDGDETLTLPSVSAFRTSGLIGAVLGLLVVVGSVGTLMTASRAFRTVGIATAAITGFIPAFAVAGVISLLVSGFAIWALLFSRQAKAIWGPLKFLGGSRRSSEA